MESLLLAAHAMANTSEVAAAVTVPEWPVLSFRDQSLGSDIFLPILGMPVSTQKSRLMVERRHENGRILCLVSFPNTTDLFGVRVSWAV